MKILITVVAMAFSSAILAKLPAPSDEARAKAAEAKQKAAHGGKVSAYQLCKAQDRTAERYRKDKKAGAPAMTGKCEDPGAFVFVPPPAPSTSPPASPETPPQPIKK